MPDAVTRKCELHYRADTIPFPDQAKRLIVPLGNAFAAGIRPREAALLGMAALHSSVTSKITARYMTKG
jgi:hypothetical protein